MNAIPSLHPAIQRSISRAPFRPAPKNALAFTLIELLTVISIIAVLMGLLFPAIEAVKENARRQQARNDLLQIVTAVKSYYTEYGKYPPLVTQQANKKDDEPDAFVGEKIGSATPKANNSALFYTLRAIAKEPNDENKLNPRRIAFLEGRSVSNPEAPRAGFLDKTSGGSGVMGAFYDPWGTQYFVMMDYNYDNVLDMGQVYSDFSSTDDKPRTGIGAFSVGKDGAIGSLKGTKGAYRSGKTVSDDIISWQ